jgi:hypothetical protein
MHAYHSRIQTCNEFPSATRHPEKRKPMRDCTGHVLWNAGQGASSFVKMLHLKLRNRETGTSVLCGTFMRSCETDPGANRPIFFLHGNGIPLFMVIQFFHGIMFCRLESVVEERHGFARLIETASEWIEN